MVVPVTLLPPPLWMVWVQAASRWGSGRGGDAYPVCQVWCDKELKTNGEAFARSC